MAEKEGIPGDLHALLGKGPALRVQGRRKRLHYGTWRASIATRNKKLSTLLFPFVVQCYKLVRTKQDLPSHPETWITAVSARSRPAMTVTKPSSRAWKAANAGLHFLVVSTPPKMAFAVHHIHNYMTAQQRKERTVIVWCGGLRQRRTIACVRGCGLGFVKDLMEAADLSTCTRVCVYKCARIEGLPEKPTKQ
eukprot:1158639-Pelagomonas_calceolata.AAC.5